MNAGKFETGAIGRQPSAAEAWRNLALDVGVALEALEEDECIVLSAKQSNLFVQFMAQGSFGMRAEAVSDYFLPEDGHLSEAQAAVLLALGWNGPTKLPDELEAGGPSPDGSANYFIDLAKPVPYDALGVLAAETLGNVFRIGHPGVLEYTAFGPNRTSIRFPHLGLRRRSAQRPF